MRPLPFACVAAVFLAVCDDGSSPTSHGEVDDTPVRVGFLVSGVRTYLNGATIAVDEVNGRGGLLGRTVELVVRTGLEEAEAAVEAAEAMIGTDRAVALIGPNRSSHAIEVGALAQRRGVPMITTAATNPGVTAAGDLVFMAAFTDQFQGRVMAEFAAGTLEVSAAAVLTERGNVYSEGIGEFFIDRFRESGGAIVAEESYERGATEFAAQLAPIAAAAPGAVFVPVRAEDVALLAAEARALPVHDAAGEPALLLGADAWDNAALLEGGGAAVDGSFFSTHFSPDTDEPTARAFVDAYLARYAIPPTGGDAVSYDAVRLFLEAAARAGSLEADAVRLEMLATRQYAGATRISHYDDDRHPTKSAVIMTIENGVKRFYRQVDP
ncbi:MAG: ABC transporter substrate-binding protein [Gemmatimonadota bacterium]|nr:ABC transporter substrate-binding protein [Gemmatimonadota bacterium]